MTEKRKNVSAGDIRAAVVDSLNLETAKKRQMVQDVFEIILLKIEGGDYFVKGGGTMLVSVNKRLIDPVWTDLIKVGKESKLDISYGYNEGFWFWRTTVIEITPRV